MRSKNLILHIYFPLFVFLFIFNTQNALSDNSVDSRLDHILNRIEKRYDIPGFSALFDQYSTNKVMDITDSASGKVYFKRPGMMRWEYEKPEKKHYISNSKTLWVFRPEDSQVMVGKAPTLSGNGKGAGLLSADINLIRQSFSITLEKDEDNKDYLLKLVPKEPGPELSLIYMSISRTTFDVVSIVTYNSSDDENRIKFTDIKEEGKLKDSMFNFTIPENTEILSFD